MPFPLIRPLGQTFTYFQKHFIIKPCFIKKTFIITQYLILSQGLQLIKQIMQGLSSSQFSSEVFCDQSNHNIAESQHYSHKSLSQFSYGIFPQGYFEDQSLKFCREEYKVHNKCPNPSNVLQNENQFKLQNSCQNLSPHNHVSMDDISVQLLEQTNPNSRQNFHASLCENLSAFQTQTKEKCLKTNQNQIRNAYPNIISSAKKRILQDDDQESVFNKKLTKLCGKASLEFEEVQVWQFKHFCRSLPREFRLKTIKHYMNYEIGSLSERKMKFVFSQFVVWFVRKRYTIQALKSKQLEFKETYFRAKNLLVYLQTTKPKKVQKPQILRFQSND